MLHKGPLVVRCHHLVLDKLPVRSGAVTMQQAEPAQPAQRFLPWPGVGLSSFTSKHVGAWCDAGQKQVLATHSTSCCKLIGLNPHVPVSLCSSTHTVSLLQVRLALELMFEGTQGTGDLAQVTGTTGEILRIGTAVTITYQAKTEQQPWPCVILEWEGGPMNDMIADAVIAVILQVRRPP